MTETEQSPVSLSSSPSTSFVHVRPSFSVIRNFDELQSTVRRIHRGGPSREGPHGNEVAVPGGPSPSAERGLSNNEIGATPKNNHNNSNNPMVPPAVGTTGPVLTSTMQNPRPPRILCLWDIDDTLLTSGDCGVRQNVMFEEYQLLRMFKTLPRSTRHLLLSQGSIDDVFAQTGRLSALRDFFKLDEGGISDDDDDPVENEGGGCCCSSAAAKEPVGRHIASISPDCLLVHLTRVDSCRKELSCMGWSEWSPRDRESNMVRWLVIRPGLWGISMARLSSLIAPSRRTVFIDGKHFRKLDIAWSCAASGHWDKVFFIDNNLCEVGIIKYGMSYSNASSLLERRRADRVFLSDFALLRASAKLYKIEVEKGERLVYADEAAELEQVSSPISRNTSFPTSMSNTHIIRDVDLIVANLHFSLLDYYRVGHRIDRGEPELMMMLSRYSGHPTFFEDQSCSDEQYQEFIKAFQQAENAIDQIIMEDLRVDGTVGTGWKRGWKPNSNKVIIPHCRTLVNLNAVKSLMAPLCRDFVVMVCQQLEKARTGSSTQQRMEALAAARKNSHAIYVDLWKESPLLDPLLIIDFAKALYKIYFSETPPSSRKVKEWKRRAIRFVSLYDPAGAADLME